jgi:DNA-binding Lrp family transcriptional regulator
VSVAYILLNSKPDSEIEIITKTKEVISKSIDPIRYEIQGVYGVYDIIVRIECQDMDTIQYLLGKIRKIDRIISTITMLVNE